MTCGVLPRISAALTPMRGCGPSLGFMRGIRDRGARLGLHGCGADRLVVCQSESYEEPAVSDPLAALFRPRSIAVVGAWR